MPKVIARMHNKRLTAARRHNKIFSFMIDSCDALLFFVLLDSQCIQRKKKKPQDMRLYLKEKKKTQAFETDTQHETDFPSSKSSLIHIEFVCFAQ